MRFALDRTPRPIRMMASATRAATERPDAFRALARLDDERLDRGVLTLIGMK